jgi:hypothetical protein
VARALGSAIEEAGHELMTRLFLEDGAGDEDGQLTPDAVFERDLDWLDACDLLVAEASGSSYGVGFEVGYIAGRAERTGKRAIVLYDERLRDCISRLVSGNTHPRCVTIAYRSADDAQAQLGEALATLTRA